MSDIINICSIQTGDGFLYSGHSVLAKQVQKFQRNVYPEHAAKFNHAGIFYWDRNRLMISEARMGGVLPCNFKDYLKEKKEHPEDILLCLKPKFQIVSEEVITESLDNYGLTKYDVINLVLWQGIRMKTHNHIWLGGKKIDEKYICYEWVCHVWNKFTNFCDNEKRAAPADAILDNRLEKREIVLI